jgi:molybdopterin molybdotransferase/putative molybdopterin biosynthesis protein
MTDQNKPEMKELEQSAAPHGGRPGGPHGGGRPPLPPEIANAPTKEEALGMLFSKWNPTQETERVPLSDALGRILCEDMYAKYNIPVVRASAMDGIAINYESVKDGIPDTTAWRLGKEYVRADTGDDFPDEYDTVIQIEQVTILPEGGIKFAPDIEIEKGQSVRPSGSNVKEGKLLCKKGTKLNVLDIASIGSGGWGEVLVVKKPRVAFLPTGSELVPVGTELQRGQNFDTNSIMAAQMLREMGAEPVSYRIEADNYDALKAKLMEMVENSDIVIINAGTSKGGEDYCTRVMEECGELIFHNVKAVPGRPMGMAMVNGKPVINLSGPSLAAFFGLVWAIRPIVARALGVPAPVGELLTGKLTEAFRTPPILSNISKMLVTRSSEGEYLITPIKGGGRGPADRSKPQPQDPEKEVRANAIYVSTIGEAPHEAGDEITVELMRGRETIGE